MKKIEMKEPKMDPGTANINFIDNFKIFSFSIIPKTS